MPLQAPPPAAAFFMPQNKEVILIGEMQRLYMVDEDIRIEDILYVPDLLQG